jgi:hypothetical protein
LLHIFSFSILFSIRIVLSLISPRWQIHNKREHRREITLEWSNRGRLDLYILDDCKPFVQFGFKFYFKISFFTGMILRIGIDSPTKGIKETSSWLATTIKDARNFEKNLIPSKSRFLMRSLKIEINTEEDSSRSDLSRMTWFFMWQFVFRHFLLRRYGLFFDPRIKHSRKLILTWVNSSSLLAKGFAYLVIWAFQRAFDSYKYKIHRSFFLFWWSSDELVMKLS